MMYLTALLTARDGVAVIAALDAAAATATAAGDPRTRSQLMADILVGRVTGRDPLTGSSPVTINLVITDTTLLAGTHPSSTHPTGSYAEADADEEGARGTGYLHGYGPIPAELVREIAAHSPTGDQAPVWLRRLYTHPTSGDLIGTAPPLTG